LRVGLERAAHDRMERLPLHTEPRRQLRELIGERLAIVVELNHVADATPRTIR
jgi:hypothetical protein